MRNFRIPYNLNFEDKIIGGKLSIRQAMWYGMPVGLLMLSMQSQSFYMNKNGTVKVDNIVLMFFIELILTTIATIFSFVKVNKVTIGQYIFLKIRFMFRKKVIKHYE